MSHALKLGFWRDEQVNDTLTRQIYVPVTRFIYSLDYSSGTHIFKNGSAAEGESFWDDRYMNGSRTYDRTHYYSLENSLGIEICSPTPTLPRTALPLCPSEGQGQLSCPW